MTLLKEKGFAGTYEWNQSENIHRVISCDCCSVLQVRVSCNLSIPLYQKLTMTSRTQTIPRRRLSGLPKSSSSSSSVGKRSVILTLHKGGWLFNYTQILPNHWGSSIQHLHPSTCNATTTALPPATMIAPCQPVDHTWDTKGERWDKNPWNI